MPHEPGDELRRIARRAMIERGLEPELPAAALTQLRALQRPGSEDGAPLRDLRARLWCSIDNDDSRDLDQLSVAEPAADGMVKILVAIADVDLTVHGGSPLDDHARANTTSVYTAAGVFPMLPERLSTDLTSLGEGVERSALVIEMTISPAGAVTTSEIYRARVCNRAKLAYDSVAAWLIGAAPPPGALAAVAGMAQQLQIQHRVAQSLKRVRHEQGALALTTSEARAVYDGGVLADLRPDEDNCARELIQYFMIAANTVVAEYLERCGSPSLRRVLPRPARWERIVALARTCQEQLPPTPDARALSAFLVRRRQAAPALFADLSLAIVKLLGAGEYVLKRPGQEAEGHFGLAVADYTHATAPNRRFPDLITQRLLKAVLARRASPYAEDQLRELAAHCTLQEGNAAKVERRVRKSAAAMLLAPRVGERFAALVTGASDQGVWVRIQQPLAEGRLVRGFAGLDVGDTVSVQLTHTDVERGYIDFVRAAAG